MTKKLKALFQIKHHLQQFQLKIPDFYSLDLELNKKTELYIASLKKGKGRPPAEKKSQKPKMSGKLEIDVDAPELEPPGSINKPSASLQDLSNVLIQITTPNFKSVQKKELFKPPVPDRKGNVVLSPKIRVISPTGQISEGKKLMDLISKGGAVRLSDYNPFMAKENYVNVNNNEISDGTNGSNATVGSEQGNEASKTEINAENNGLVNEAISDNNVVPRFAQ